MDRQTDTHTFLGYYNADTWQGRQQVSLSESHEKKKEGVQVVMP